jgi:hypothetical protein
MSSHGADRWSSTPSRIRATDSGGITIVILQQPTEPFAALEGASILRDMIGRGYEDHIAFPLI